MLKKTQVAFFLLFLLFYYCFLLTVYLSVLFNHNILKNSKWTVVLALLFLIPNYTAAYYVCAGWNLSAQFVLLGATGPGWQMGSSALGSSTPASQTESPRGFLWHPLPFQLHNTGLPDNKQAFPKLFWRREFHHWPMPGPGSDFGVGHHRVLVLKGKFSLLNRNIKTHINNEIRKLNPLIPTFGCVEGSLCLVLITVSMFLFSLTGFIVTIRFRGFRK